MNSEIWKPVVGWEGWYEDFYKVSNEGRVRSLDRMLEDGRQLKGRMLKPGLSNGYLMVTLSRQGNLKTIRIHKLVCEAFIGPCPKGYVVCHGIGGKLDNRLENLKYATESENHFDQYRDGTMSCAKQVKSSKGKIYRSIMQAERDTGISNQNISGVLRGRQKSAGGLQWEYV